VKAISEKPQLPFRGYPSEKQRVVAGSPAPWNRRRWCRRTGVPVVLPITTGGGFARTAGFAVSLMGTGLQTTGVVRCDQPRALDLKARGAKKLEAVPDAIIDEVLSKVGPLFE
jgi:mRNA-degrading endonuclease toxin of MazEF toxin-antitoxin module